VTSGLRRWMLRGATLVIAAAGIEVVAPGCSVGEGTGSVTGTLNVPLCWSGSFNLNPNFFAAVPYNYGSTDSGSPDAADNSAQQVSELEIRIQNGGDYETFSDGVLILVDNVHEIRGDPPYTSSEYGKKLKLGLPPEVVAPGVPIQPVSNPASVSLTLYLEKSCQTEQIGLYALDAVTLGPDGTCNPTEAGPITLQCATDTGLVDGGAPDAGHAEAGAALRTASSWIEFTSLFDGNPYEANAAERYTAGTFHAYLGDPTEGCPGGLGPPPPCRGFIVGQFSFYFERGQPAQPFQ
jgi:hypothetical protein